MKVNIYYGGRGILGDPTVFVITKMMEVLSELNVKVERINLYEHRSEITSLPATMNDADAIVLASTVEWYGFGGYLTQFLDACWLYGNKEKIAETYMFPVVMSQVSGEREAKMRLQTAWEILGGNVLSGICGYVEDMMNFESDEECIKIIEKQTENLYRSVSQKAKSLPSSFKADKQVATVRKNLSLTPQETEQLSKYASDETYVQKQKEDISELSSMFKGMLEKKSIDENTMYISDFEENFRPHGDVTVKVKFVIDDKKRALIVDIADSKLKCYYGNTDDVDVQCKLSSDLMDRLVGGQMSFQRAFMSGENMQIRGDFKKLSILDQVFTFLNEK